jgi:hypothetical protein
MPMSEQFDAFKKEVEEDLQRERMRKLWEQYGTYIIGACAALVLAVAGWKLLENRRIAAAENNSAKYVSALRALSENKTDEGAKALDALSSAPGGYGLLAKLRLAASQAAAGDAVKAAAGYEAVSRMSGVDKVVTDYARLQAAMLKIDSSEWTDIKTRLIDLTVDNNPWRHAAQELMGFSAYRTGNITDARGVFEKLVADPAAPAAIKERASVVMGMLVQADLAKASGQAGSTPGAATTPASPAPAAPKAAPETPGTKTK